MARFVIADISDAKSVLQELQAIVPDNPKVPVQPIIVAAQEEPGMFDSFKAYPWFLKVHRYDNPAQLLSDLEERVIGPLRRRRRNCGRRLATSDRISAPSRECRPVFLLDRCRPPISGPCRQLTFPTTSWPR